MTPRFFDWLDSAPILIVGGFLLVCMIAASLTGYTIHKRQARSGKPDLSDAQEGYVVSAVLGLLALLMAFTFALAIDRFETRRELVLADANAIGTAYLRVQLLPEPHRTRLSGLLLQLVDTKVVLAKTPRGENGELLAQDDRLLTDIWAADAAAFDSIKGIDFSSTFVDSMNTMIDLDASRRAARTAHVPSEVFALLLLYLVVTAGLLGYALSGTGGRFTGGLLLILLTLALLLVLDIDHPTSGGIIELQGPMERLRASLHKTPPAVYDRWRTEAPG